MAFDEDGQPDLMQDGHDPSGCLAEPQRTAGSVEPKVVGQQHPDCLGAHAADELEVDNHLARHGLFIERVEVGTKQLDHLPLVQLAHLRRDHEDVLDDLVLESLFGLAIRLVGRGERDCPLAFTVIRLGNVAFLLQPAGRAARLQRFRSS